MKSVTEQSNQLTNIFRKCYIEQQGLTFYLMTLERDNIPHNELKVAEFLSRYVHRTNEQLNELKAYEVDESLQEDKDALVELIDSTLESWRKIITIHRSLPKGTDLDYPRSLSDMIKGGGS